MEGSLSQLEQCVTQYPIMESLAACLTSTDLYNLAKTSKTTWENIAVTKEQWKNLAQRGLCASPRRSTLESEVRMELEASRRSWLRGRGYRPGTTICIDGLFEDWKADFASSCGAVNRNVLTQMCEKCHIMVCTTCVVCSPVRIRTGAIPNRIHELFDFLADHLPELQKDHKRPPDQKNRHHLDFHIPRSVKNPGELNGVCVKNPGALNSFLFSLPLDPRPGVWICWPCLRRERCRRSTWDSTVGWWSFDSI
jgi:hypothetical protein